MPTPSPSSTDSVGANVAMVMTLASSPTPARDTAMDSTAVMSGSDIATSEPKTRNSTIAAAVSPTSSSLPCSGGPFAAWPVTSTCTPSRGSAATSSSSSTWARLTSFGMMPSSCTGAKAVRPSGETCCGASYGEVTDTTESSPRSSSTTASTCARGPGSVSAPSSTAKTAVSASPLLSGLTRSSSWKTDALSVSGSVNSSS